MGRSICANCGRVKPTRLVKDGQQDVMHNSSYVTQIQCNTLHSKTLQLQNCNNRRSNQMTYCLNIMFTNTKPAHARSHTFSSQRTPRLCMCKAFHPPVADEVCCCSEPWCQSAGASTNSIGTSSLETMFAAC